MNHIQKYQLFYVSVLAGPLIWLISFVVLPVEPVEEIVSNVVLFIFLCYFSLIIGFKFFNFSKTTGPTKSYTTPLIKWLTVIVIFSFALRWFDLFHYRELSFMNAAIENRRHSDLNSHKGGLIFTVAAVLKSLYFFPFILVLKNRLVLKKYFIISLMLLLLPVLEAILLGTRKQYFEIFLILFISIIYFKRNRLSFKLLVLGGVILTALFVISSTVLLNRESFKSNQDNLYSYILEAKYNDLLKPKPKVKEFISDNESPNILRASSLIMLQTGQYINHGFFEFNHIYKKEELDISYGAYVFNPFIKLLNKIRGSKNVLYNPSPRKIVYLTAFGSFFIDFRWATVLLFLVFGIFQRYIFDRSTFNGIYYPILIYIAIINIFLPIFNYVKGSGVYPIVGFFILLLVYQLFNKSSHEKSISA